MKETNFSTVTGLNDENNISTPNELMYLISFKSLTH